ncbi:DUF58 domain-containing protein (plasmid) [Streptomycetaceae bacterium NBC_01309]
MSLLLGTLGWASGHPEPTALGLAGAFLVGSGMLLTVPRPRLQARRRLSPTHVARGDTAGGDITVTNAGKRPYRGLVAEDHCDGNPVTVVLPRLGAGQTIRARYHLPTHRRGSVVVGPLRLVHTDVFGLARRTVPIGDATALLVHPRVQPLDAPPTGHHHHLDGQTSPAADEGTTTFDSLREYAQGDDLRRVHWRSTARTGKLMVRRMSDVSLPSTTLLLDTDSRAYPGPHGDEDFELAVDVAASVGHAVTTRNFPLDLWAGRASLALPAPRRGLTSEALLGVLAEVRQDAGDNLAAGVERLRRARNGGALVVVTGWGTATGLAAHLAPLVADRELVLVARAGARPSDKRADLPTGLPQIAVTRLSDVRGLWQVLR